MNQELGRKVYELIGKARALGETLEAVAVLEEAVALADAHDDASLGYTARMRLIDTVAFTGQSDKTLVAFSWCLACADKLAQDPKYGEFSRTELLWKYKWVLEKLTQFPKIPRAQIYSALDDFQARCRKIGC